MHVLEKRKSLTNLSLHLKNLEKKVNPSESEEVRAEINEIGEKNLETINETNSWLFEKINKNLQTCGKISKEKKTKMSSIRNKIRAITADLTDMTKILREYYKQLCTEKNGQFRRHELIPWKM